MTTYSDEFVEVLLRQYAANSGNNFDDHYNQGAARQWMKSALEAASDHMEQPPQDLGWK